MRVTVLGAGSFGTSLAKLLGENKHDVLVWSHSKDTADAINGKHENIKYLPGFTLPPNITATHEVDEALKESELILSVIPTQATREVIQQCKDFIGTKVPIIVCSKGIERETHKLVCDIFLDVLGSQLKEHLFFLSGPSFAKEIASQVPTAVTLAGYNEESIPQIQEIFRSKYFRTYGTSDVIGVELSGALKNVIAIACGVSDGLGMGSNTKAAIITRGLTEIVRLGKSMGADPLTFMGLAGMGDLVLTCTGDLSRNRTVGIRIGEGMPLKEVLANMDQVAEGVPTAQSAYELASEKGVSMPISTAIYEVLYKDRDPKDVMKELMSRNLKLEKE